MSCAFGPDVIFAPSLKSEQLKSLLSYSSQNSSNYSKGQSDWQSCTFGNARGGIKAFELSSWTQANGDGEVLLSQLQTLFIHGSFLSRYHHPGFLRRLLKYWGEAVTHCSSWCKTLNQAVPLQSWVFQQQNLESRRCSATPTLNTPQWVLKLQLVGWKGIVLLLETIPWEAYFSPLGILKDKMFVFVSGVLRFHKSRI